MNNHPVLTHVCCATCVRGLYIPEVSLYGGDLHRMEMEQPVEAGDSRTGPSEPLWAEFCFLCLTCWPPYTHNSQTHTPFTKHAQIAGHFLLGIPPADCP